MYIYKYLYANKLKRKGKGGGGNFAAIWWNYSRVSIIIKNMFFRAQVTIDEDKLQVEFNVQEYKPEVSSNAIIVVMDKLLLGCYTRFSCPLIKWCLQRAKKNDTPNLCPFYPPRHPSYWMHELTKFHVSNLNWRQFSPVTITSILHFNTSILILLCFNI